jgi:tetratricopeptide (TPR) repeat protein
MAGVKRLAVLLALIGLVAAGVGYGQRLEQDRRFRRLLADGEQALAQGQSYQAIEHFSGALALRPRSMVAYYHRGEAYRAERLHEQAIRDLREAARLSPNAPQPLEALGKLHDDRGEPARAADWYRQAADRLQDADPALLYSLALALYRSGAPAAAKEPLQLALSRQDSAAGRYLLGLVYRDAQSIEDALVSLEHAVKLAPSLIPAREELADLYRETGRTDDELRQLRALALLDDQIDRRIATGLAESRAGRFDTALDVLHGTSVAAPTDSRVLLATGRVHLARAERTGDRRAVAQALAALEKALGGTARRSEGLALYGRALYLSGDTAGAERILQEALSTSPIDEEAFAFLADAAERAGHPAVARAALVDLDALQGDTVSAEQRGFRARRMGALSLGIGDVTSAVRFLSQAIDTTPPDAATLGLLARARWLAGDAAGAKVALGRALQLSASDPTLRRLERTIR